MFSGIGAVKTSETHLSTTVRSLYTGMRMDSFMGLNSLANEAVDTSWRSIPQVLLVRYCLGGWCVLMYSSSSFCSAGSLGRPYSSLDLYFRRSIFCLIHS